MSLGIESQGLCPQVPGHIHLHHQHPWRQPPLSMHGGRNLNCSRPPPIPPSKPGLASPLGRPGAGGACGGTSTDAKIPEGWCRGFLLMASSPSCSACSLLEGNRKGPDAPRLPHTSSGTQKLPKHMTVNWRRLGGHPTHAQVRAQPTGYSADWLGFQSPLSGVGKVLVFHLTNFGSILAS